MVRREPGFTGGMSGEAGREGATMEIGKFGLLTTLVVVLFGLGGFFGYMQITSLQTRVANLETRMGPAESNGKQAYTGMMQLKPYVDTTYATANKAAKDAADAMAAANAAKDAAAAAKDTPAANAGAKRK
jgi:hypothetical protein